jgi:hypothetical protein
MLVKTEADTFELTERRADSEFELQNVLRQAPNLIPVDDLGLDGPLMVVGRETALPSGRVDLLTVTPAGDVLIIEFKTGPQNPDYRHALAQLLDYASDLWQMDPGDFATNVVVSYLATRHCPPSDPAHGATTLRDAATRTWPGLDADELDAFENSLARRLSEGRFHLVLAAQRVTRNLRTTIEFLQQSEAKVAFHAVELVKFTDDERITTAYEGRAVTTPTRRGGRGTTGVTVDIETVLDSYDDPVHRERLETLVEYCRSLQLTFEPGSKGFSIRMGVPDRAEPVSVAWVFPPDAGYLGMRGLNLGFDLGIVRKLSVAPRFKAYAARLHDIDGAVPISAKAIDGVGVPPEVLTTQQDAIIGAIGELISGIQGAS